MSLIWLRPLQWLIPGRPHFSVLNQTVRCPPCDFAIANVSLESYECVYRDPDSDLNTLHSSLIHSRLCYFLGRSPPEEQLRGPSFALTMCFPIRHQDVQTPPSTKSHPDAPLCHLQLPLCPHPDQPVNNSSFYGDPQRFCLSAFRPPYISTKQCICCIFLLLSVSFLSYLSR